MTYGTDEKYLFDILLSKLNSERQQFLNSRLIILIRSHSMLIVKGENK